MSEIRSLILNVKDKNRWNCVLFARSRCPKLPFGLWTIKDKKKICNDNTPRVGSVAVMNVGLPWGHVGIVTAVGKNHITIQEANFKIGKITERHNTIANLKIVGYFNPSYPQGT